MALCKSTECEKLPSSLPYSHNVLLMKFLLNGLGVNTRYRSFWSAAEMNCPFCGQAGSDTIFHWASCTGFFISLATPCPISTVTRGTMRLRRTFQLSHLAPRWSTLPLFVMQFDDVGVPWGTVTTSQTKLTSQLIFSKSWKIHGFTASCQSQLNVRDVPRAKLLRAKSYMLAFTTPVAPFAIRGTNRERLQELYIGRK